MIGERNHQVYYTQGTKPKKAERDALLGNIVQIPAYAILAPCRQYVPVAETVAVIRRAQPPYSLYTWDETLKAERDAPRRGLIRVRIRGTSLG